MTTRLAETIIQRTVLNLKLFQSAAFMLHMASWFVAWMDAIVDSFHFFCLFLSGILSPHPQSKAEATIQNAKMP
jgi:hypothetical protein